METKSKQPTTEELIFLNEQVIPHGPILNPLLETLISESTRNAPESNPANTMDDRDKYFINMLDDYDCEIMNINTRRQKKNETNETNYQNTLNSYQHEYTVADVEIDDWTRSEIKKIREESKKKKKTLKDEQSDRVIKLEDKKRKRKRKSQEDGDDMKRKMQKRVLYNVKHLYF